MKNFFYYALIALFLVVIVFAFMYATRLFSNASTPITIHKPVDGVTCATMVTSDGAAISCWKD